MTQDSLQRCRNLEPYIAERYLYLYTVCVQNCDDHTWPYPTSHACVNTSQLWTPYYAYACGSAHQATSHFLMSFWRVSAKRPFSLLDFGRCTSCQHLLQRY